MKLAKSIQAKTPTKSFNKQKFSPDLLSIINLNEETTKLASSNPACSVQNCDCGKFVPSLLDKNVCKTCHHAWLEHRG